MMVGVPSFCASRVSSLANGMLSSVRDSVRIGMASAVMGVLPIWTPEQTTVAPTCSHRANAGLLKDANTKPAIRIRFM